MLSEIEAILHAIEQGDWQDVSRSAIIADILEADGIDRTQMLDTLRDPHRARIVQALYYVRMRAGTRDRGLGQFLECVVPAMAAIKMREDLRKTKGWTDQNADWYPEGSRIVFRANGEAFIDASAIDKSLWKQDDFGDWVFNGGG